MLSLAEAHPDVDIFKGSSEFEKVIFLDATMNIENVEALLNKINQLFLKMTQQYAIKSDQQFINFFGINDNNSTP